MELPEAENMTPLISLNVNGFRQGDNYQDVLKMVQTCTTSSIDWASFGETNTDWRSAACSKVYEKFHQIYHFASISTSSSTMKYNKIYQLGGTATVLTDK
jgi:hypothetical protein